MGALERSVVPVEVVDHKEIISRHVLLVDEDSEVVVGLCVSDIGKSS